MVDQSGAPLPGGGWAGFVERRVEDSNFKFWARTLMIIGGAVAPIAGGLVVTTFVIVLGIRDDVKDTANDLKLQREKVGEHAKAIEKLQDGLRLVERRQDLDSGRR